MNGHVSKPIDPELLYQKLNDMLSPRVAVKPSQVTTSSNKTLVPVDKINQQKAIKLLRGDEKLYWELVGDFIEMEAQIAELDQAIEVKNHQVIFRILHSYRTSLSYVGAYELSEFAVTLERQIKEKQQNVDTTLIQQLREFAAKTQSVTQYFRLTTGKS